jgi:hypothetical protein|tara:strand:- start:16 stop:267 length:252 start_codon:yes stop_codon:yes gene_type:complete
MNESPNEKAKMILEYGESKAMIERLRLEKLYIAESLEDLKESYVLCEDEPTEGDFDRLIPQIEKTLDAFNCYEISRMLRYCGA